MAHAVEQQMQKLLEETQLDMNEFDNLLQPIIDTCTKDAISVRAGGRGVLPKQVLPPDEGDTPRLGCSRGGLSLPSLSS